LSALGVTAFVLLFGGVFSGSQAADPIESAIAAAHTTRLQQDALTRLLAGLSTGDTAAYVRKLERRVQRDPADGDALALLGLAYQQRGRETGDPSFYSLSDRALGQAQTAGGPALVVTEGEAALANTRHRFRRGLELARAAVTLDQNNGSALGALGDALLNLGRYREAFHVYDRMALAAPGIASYTRVANARELLGRPLAAADADRAALEIDHAVPEHVAWTMMQLGNVSFNRGDLRTAEEGYEKALARYPGYVHAEAGLARVEAARGELAKAATRLRRAVAVLPAPAYVILLGDVLRAAGRSEQARREYALVSQIERLFAANGVRTELQTALFDLDHRHGVPAALARARSAYRAAPSIYAEDALAWGLYRTGNCAAARRHSTHALRLGTRDALLTFHRAMIERCLGSPAARSWFRRALGINPHFSVLWAPVARRALVARRST
jgi:tetratricopeptide (TPR) repeat protein